MSKTEQEKGEKFLFRLLATKAGDEAAEPRKPQKYQRLPAPDTGWGREATQRHSPGASGDFTEVS